MTREQQIYKKAEGDCIAMLESIERCDIIKGSICPQSYRAGFMDGAKWAGSHPQWMPVEKELPKHKVEDNGLITYEEVLVCLNDGYVTTDCYDDTRKKWLGYNGDVEYWMPTPQPPRKEDKNE